MGNKQASQPFTKKDVEILAKLSGRSEKEVEDWYKEFHIESEETDRMNRRQFQIFYTKLKKNPKLDRIADHIFRAFDTDHSGTVDIREFLLAYIATNASSNREKFEYAFEVYDINDNNQIERKEAEKILNIICRIIGLSEGEARAYIETIMVSFDANQDKVLTKEEFINGCVSDPSLAKIANPFSL